MPAVMVAQVLGSQGDRNNGGQQANPTENSAPTAAGDNGALGKSYGDIVLLIRSMRSLTGSMR